jgi:hypothetical protein
MPARDACDAWRPDIGRAPPRWRATSPAGRRSARQVTIPGPMASVDSQGTQVIRITNRFRPTGGVMMPISMFTTRTMPGWIGSMPGAMATQNTSGATITMSPDGSMNCSPIGRITLTMTRTIIRPRPAASSASAIFCRIRSSVIPCFTIGALAVMNPGPGPPVMPTVTDDDRSPPPAPPPRFAPIRPGFAQTQQSARVPARVRSGHAGAGSKGLRQGGRVESRAIPLTAAGTNSAMLALSWPVFDNASNTASEGSGRPSSLAKAPI